MFFSRISQITLTLDDITHGCRNSSYLKSLFATSLDRRGQLMSLRHKTYDVSAVQYHPESVLTPHGKKILDNWINSLSMKAILNRLIQHEQLSKEEARQMIINIADGQYNTVKSLLSLPFI